MATTDAPIAGRRCGSCTLCCKLLPVSEGVQVDHAYSDAHVQLGYKLNALLPPFVKAAGERCQHQCSKGCRVHGTAKMPVACRAFSCLWLTGDDRWGHRPDRARYVIDPMGDHIAIGGERVRVVQVWIDPAFPEAWRTPGFMAFAQAYAERYGYAFILRFNERDASVLLPPALSPDGGWILTPRQPANAKIGELAEI